MVSPQPWITLSCMLLGNCGFWLFCFNRINATGLLRSRTKRIEKLFIAACFLIPLAIALFEWDALTSWLSSSGWWPPPRTWLCWWGACSVASAVALGSLWLESRLWMIAPPQLIGSTSQHYHVSRQIEGGSPADKLTRFLESLPGNQITELEVTCKELSLTRPIARIDGLKIGHLSDLHFTGQYRPEHYHFVIDRLLELAPDLIVITGDIIDYDKCLPWIEPLLGKLKAPLGCTYLLGNHDRRLKNLQQMLSSMNSLGHHDLGVSDQTIVLGGGSRISLTGNESPWFERHASDEGRAASNAEMELEPNSTLRLGLSHSPDQIRWARRLKLDLLLAGHTHGGQVRFPLIGPIVAPSRHGTRYASGVFYLHPTLMHVSRGVAGTHPLRWWCKPEISLLTLRCASPENAESSSR